MLNAVIPSTPSANRIFQAAITSRRSRQISAAPNGAMIRNAPNDRQNASPSGGNSPITARPTMVLPAKNAAVRVSAP